MLGVGVVAAVVYALGACPTFGGGWSPAVAAALGMPAASYVSAAMHAATLAFLYKALRRRISTGAALGACAALGFSPWFWYYSLVPGFMPLVNLAAVLLAARLRWGWAALIAAGALAHGLPGDAYAAALARERALPALVGAAALLGHGLERLRRPWLAAIFVIPAVVAPHSLRRHNPTAEYAREIVAQTEDDAVIVADGPELRWALQALGGGRRLVVAADPPAGRPVWHQRPCRGCRPVRMLFTAAPQVAAAAAAQEAAAIPAFRAIRRWDRYHFTPEVFLVDVYRDLLTAHLAGAADEPTRSALRRHLEEL